MESGWKRAWLSTISRPQRIYHSNSLLREEQGVFIGVGCELTTYEPA